MHDYNKHYCFLLTHTTKSKIYIRRVAVRKQLVHSTFAFFVFSLVIVSAGVFSLSRFGVLAKNESPEATASIADQSVPAQTTDAPRTPSYNRPEGSDQFAVNSGGPDSDLQLDDENAANAGDGEVEKQLRSIQNMADPSSLPTSWAHLGKINNEFGFRRNPFGGRSYEFHAGMDIDGERGDSVMAPGNGIVIKAGWQGGYGNMIEIDHGNGITTRYGHLSKIEVAIGQSVARGELIGLIGTTGRSTGPHLHYELRLNDKPINPRFFLPPEPTDIKVG